MTLKKANLRILVVDDHRMFRDALNIMLKRQPGMEVVGLMDDGRGVMEAIQQLRPDLVIMDVHLGEVNGIELSRQIKAKFPEIKIVILSGDRDSDLVNKALQADVSGYLLKVHATDVLLQAIQAVTSGKIYLCPEVATAVVTDYRKLLASGNNSSGTSQLSVREREVLKLTAEGLRTKEIAQKLNVGVKSAETYRARLMTKLGCSSTADLTRYAIREGIIEP